MAIRNHLKMEQTVSMVSFQDFVFFVVWQYGKRTMNTYIKNF
jgi:hypothetical protein